MERVSPRCAALCASLGEYDSLVEVGIGRRPTVAAALAARSIDVTATDIVIREVPTGVRFVRDDAVDPNLAVYRDADAIYALNSPPELHRPIRKVAQAAGVPFLFTTLGTDPPAIPATAETLPQETLFRAVGRNAVNDHDRPNDSRPRDRRAR